MPVGHSSAAVNRRTFLATGASLAAATVGGCTGCVQGPAASFSMAPVTDAGIAREVTMHLERDEDADRFRLVTEAVENESTTREGTEPPFPRDRPFVYDGTVYELTYEVTESTPATVFSFTLNPVENPPRDQTVRFETLPAVDREKFRRRGWADGDFLGFGSSLLYLQDEIPDSALVPDPDHPVVVWDADTKGRFTVDGSRDTDLETYRYESRVVNASAAAFGAQVRRRYAFTLSRLTAAERDIVRTAIDEEHGFQVPHDETPPDALRRLADRFRPHEDVEAVWEDEDEQRESRVSGNYIVRYDREVYWTRLSVPAMVTASP